MSKQHLMLSAAMAVLCASAVAALADTEISTASSTPLATTTAGNITIDSSGGIQVSNGGAVLTLDSNNSITDNGVLANGNKDGSIAILIDTTNQDILAQGKGLISSNSITVTGTGATHTGLEVLGGNRYFGGITMSNLTAQALLGGGTTITVSGESDVVVFRTQSGSIIDGDVAFGGPLTAQMPVTTASGALPPALALLSGTLNGNLVFDSTVAGSSVGANSRGIVILGGLHACANDATAEAAAGFTCGTGGAGLGALLMGGKIVTAGQVLVDPTSKNPVLEGGSALAVGASIDGGIFVAGPFTANSAISAGVLSGNGVSTANLLNPVVQIDPNLAGANATALHIGPISSLLDPIDPGYSFINRGGIAAAPAVAQLSTAAMFVEGAAPSIYTCLGNGDLTSCGNDGKGGLLNTGSIAAKATTNATGVVTSNVNASALIVGAYAVIPRLDLKAENTGLGTTTSGNIDAEVTGTSGGIANAITIAQLASLPVIDVGQGASITAGVSTSTLNPTLEIAPANAPFTLSATAISDGSSTLKTINNAGTIAAAITTVTPGLGANVVTTVRAIDLTSSTANGITINNSGRILGDIYYGAGGKGHTLNVGNTGAGDPNFIAANSPNNYAVVAYSVISQASGSPPVTIFNQINFGAGGSDVLHVGAFGYVNSVITSAVGGLAVTVDQGGTLFVANTTNSLNASTFDIKGGTLGLTISQNTTATTPVIKATTEATILANSSMALQFGSFVSSSTSHTLSDYTTPATQHLVLISAPTVTDTGLDAQNAILSQNLPFVFQPNSKPLTIGSAAGNQTLELALTPRVPGLGSGKRDDSSAADIAGLGLTGDALAQFPYVASALATDPSLGSAIAGSLTVYKTPGVATSGINIAASQQKAQQAFSQFGPDTSGGARQVAILITDQASGPVAARQRLLRSYSKAPGDLTLWGTEFAGNINNKGRVDADGTLTDYKDHGFGFSLGLDSGSPRGGWFGGAFTFYSGDVTQSLPRDTKTHTQWYMLSGYTSWKGGHLFFDSQLSAAYGSFNGTRDLTVGSTVREASGKRAGLMGAAGVNMGATFAAGRLEIDPHFSLDGLTLREEGYSETGGGSGLNLQVAPYYANSLRAALGMDFSAALNIFGVTMKPEARLGYRYDLANTPVKLKAGFLGTGGLSTTGNSMTFVGPDPDSGNLLGGLSLSAGTDTWHLGVHYDYLRGNNGSVTQVGTISLLGRI
ncbi:MAG: autotransporter outer membrane beta-barrel domain-containing protein [Alphaproteobacteria bacterium]|nr:autotransporter outer membrane beta-barrel domain-containing protein [Alphaproteobacteria bacterium]